MVGWVQLDNQTQDPVAPVVVAPTMVEHPQATLQMSFIRNNVKSHSHLNHFEVKRGHRTRASSARPGVLYPTAALFAKLLCCHIASVLQIAQPSLSRGIGLCLRVETLQLGSFDG